MLAGREVPDALDNIRRYCGLPWSGGRPEIWAYRYFDALPFRRSDNAIRAEDVVACSALHPGFTRNNLTFFVDERPRLEDLLSRLPPGVDLGGAGEGTLAAVTSLAELAGPGCGLALLSRVFHFKRPRLVPIFDRSLVEWYRPILKVRGESSWTPLVSLLQGDLASASNAASFAVMREELGGPSNGLVPSPLRMADIAIWMQSAAPG